MSKNTEPQQEESVELEASDGTQLDTVLGGLDTHGYATSFKEENDLGAYDSLQPEEKVMFILNFLNAQKLSFYEQEEIINLAGNVIDAVKQGLIPLEKILLIAGIPKKWDSSKNFFDATLINFIKDVDINLLRCIDTLKYQKPIFTSLQDICGRLGSIPGPIQGEISELLYTGKIKKLSDLDWLIGFSDSGELSLGFSKNEELLELFQDEYYSLFEVGLHLEKNKNPAKSNSPETQIVLDEIFAKNHVPITFEEAVHRVIRPRGGMKRRDISGLVQRIRNREIILYDDMIVKYVHPNKTDQNSRDVDLLDNDYEKLMTLQKTGVVPKVIDYKIYENGKRRLVSERINGSSLDFGQKNYDFDPEKMNEYISQSANVLQKIHDEGVVSLDVNGGGFIFNEAGCKGIDFEFGVSIDKEDLTERVIDHIYRKNPDAYVMYTMGSSPQVSGDILKQMDVSSWATIFVDLVCSAATAEIPYKDFEGEGFSRLRDHIVSYGEDAFEKKKPDSELTKEYVEERIQKTLSDTMKGLTFRGELEKQGIKVNESFISFIERALSPDFEERPTNFSELLNS